MSDLTEYAVRIVCDDGRIKTYPRISQEEAIRSAARFGAKQKATVLSRRVSKSDWQVCDESDTVNSFVNGRSYTVMCKDGELHETIFRYSGMNSPMFVTTDGRRIPPSETVHVWNQPALDFK